MEKLDGDFRVVRKIKNEIHCKKGRGYTFEIAGEASYQDALLSAVGGKKQENGFKLDKTATLRPDASNPHDANAIAVFIQNRKVGYLRRSDAPIFGAFLKEFGAESAVCNAKIVGGWNDGKGNEGHFGVKLSLSWPPRVAD